MHSSPSIRLRIALWVFTLLLPLAAWEATSATSVSLHLPIGVFFIAAAVITAAIGGLVPALISSALNVGAFLGYSYVHLATVPHRPEVLWSLLLVSVALVVGLAREKWSSAEVLAGHLSTDLARLRDELDAQRSDLKRFHELSVSLSSSLELQRLLNDVLAAIAALQKTDLAMLLLLPHSSSKTLRVETYAGFTAEQIELFGEFPAAFFSTQRRVMVEDIEMPGTYFPFVDAATQVGFRALFSTPIINSRGEALGVVATFFRKPHAPSDRQSRLVELYARQAANALDNARLYRHSLETLAAERQRSAVLRSLAEASLQINSALNLDSLLQVITGQARKIVAARQAFTTLLPNGERNQSITCTSVDEGQDALPFPPERSEMFTLACSLNKPVRITAGTQGNHAWRTMMKSSDAARDGWLAAPLLTRDGRNLGLIQLSQKINGEFTEDDEAILVHLTHMASVAVDNVRLYREAQEQIAETRRTQEALHRSKESMQLAQRCVGIAIWEWDLQSGELVWSDEICRLHGIEPARFDGRYESWMESIHLEDSWRVHASITDALAKHSEYEAEYRVAFPDKSVHWLEARGQTIVMGNTPVRMLGVVLDITSRKMVEEALRRSEKLAATGQLAASIAHEINNPLAAVTNVLYILRTHPELTDQLTQHVNTAERELARVIHITRQTLAFYREFSRPVMTSVPDLLEEVLSIYNRKIDEQGITIHKRFRDVEELRAFPGELRQVFSNLVLNALEALPGAGTISIRVRRATGVHGNPGIRITVADTGTGIALEDMPRIFEPFFTTKESRGTGLGLWVSLGIVHKHDGSIRVRSSARESRHGTCFVVFIPYAPAFAQAGETAEGAEETVPKFSTKSAGSGSDLSVA
ncbi:MAG TPA: ATP-binding protein [Candidatus Angelobacter sp.]|nr:ATP-binding protein [Candidatus Angelobacter sp.]